MDPYSKIIAVGTVCSTTCPSWKDSTLHSSCLLNGKWSPTKPVSGPKRTFGYAAPYPTPDQPDMVCGCEDDPNTEDGAQLVYQGWGPEQYQKEGVVLLLVSSIYLILKHILLEIYSLDIFHIH